jgi:ABC-type branched-subunit amino acid transport system permease subunit
VVFFGLGLAADAIATGGLGTLTGVALGALDTFYIDKLISGWKPSQFIEEDVKELIKNST